MITVDLRNAIALSCHTSTSTLDATALSEPDPNWVFVDAAGHEHRWSKSFTLPTLEAIQATYYDEYEGEEYTVTDYYECKICRALIIPGTRPGQLHHIAGLSRREVEATLPDTDQFGALQEAVHTGQKCIIRMPTISQQLGYVTGFEINDNNEIRVTIRGCAT